MWSEDGIILSIYKPFLKITLDVACQLVESRLKLNKGIAMPLFIDVRKVSYADDKARKYLASEEGSKLISAGAMLVDGPISQFLANVFLKVYHPVAPLKIFTDQKKAIEWLQKYK